MLLPPVCPATPRGYARGLPGAMGPCAASQLSQAHRPGLIQAYGRTGTSAYDRMLQPDCDITRARGCTDRRLDP
jgi:hypothetical protein